MTPLGGITPNNSPDLRRTFKIDVKQKEKNCTQNIEQIKVEKYTA